MSHEARHGCVAGPPLATDVGAAMTELRGDTRPEEDPFRPPLTPLLSPCPSSALTPADHREELLLEREEGKGLRDGASEEVPGLPRSSLSFAAPWACLSRLPSPSSPPLPPWAFLSPFMTRNTCPWGRCVQAAGPEPMPVPPDPPGSAAP